MSEKLNRVEAVIQKYRLGETTFIDAEENGKKLGDGKLMADQTLQNFIDGDPSGNNKYLDWILFQSGGGQDAMEKSLSLWNGDSAQDVNSLRNQCRQDFIDEQTKGFTEKGIYHKPVSKEVAQQEWEKWEERAKFEFLMGDQDVAIEDGYGFFRHWPGRDGQYVKILNAVKLWHMAQTKLMAQNQRFTRMTELRERGTARTPEEKAFIAKNAHLKALVEMDIYAGWRPKQFSQEKAVYKNMGDLLRVLADVRRMHILRDLRALTVYENDLVQAICPLTVGASIHFGIGKWCVCNKTDFERSFDPKAGSNNNWRNYSAKGPLVFMLWKCAMPPWLHKIALHIMKESMTKLREPWDSGINWIDCKNEPTATNYANIVARIIDEAGKAKNKLMRLDDKPAAILVRRPAPGVEEEEDSTDNRYYQWGGRTPGPAWRDAEQGAKVLATLEECLETVRAWSKTFDHRRVVLDYLTDTSGPVDKIDD